MSLNPVVIFITPEFPPHCTPSITRKMRMSVLSALESLKTQRLETPLLCPTYPRYTDLRTLKKIINYV